MFLVDMMDKKVLLINPFLTVFPDDPSGVSPPLGLAYLAAFLRRSGIEVKIIDAAAEGIDNQVKIGGKTRYGLSNEDLRKRILDFDPQIVGITCPSTLHAKDAHETAKLVKECHKNILVVMGGAHPSAVPEEVLKDRNVDLVVRGEGEATFLDVVKNYSKTKNLKRILGISYRKSKKIIHNLSRPLIKNLDLLPFPDRHLLPMEIYFREAEKAVNYNFHNRVVTMITSRGCPGNCIYCAVKTVWGRTWRGRSPENVVDEIEEIVQEFKVKEIHFLDDSLAVDKKRLAGICEEIIRRKLPIKWATPNGIAIWQLDKILLAKMKKAGCYRLTFGLESGNKKILNNFIGKHYDYHRARDLIRFASRIGLWTVGTFIIGFPYETLEQIEDTISLAVASDLDFAVFYLANPFPGTALYEICRKENLLPPEGVYENVRGCRSRHFSQEELEEIQGEAFDRFLKSRIKKPLIFLSKIESLGSLTYTAKLGKNLIGVLFCRSAVREKGIAALWK